MQIRKTDTSIENPKESISKIFLLPCGKNSSRRVFKTAPPSVAARGIAVKIPINRFMYASVILPKEKNAAIKIKLTANPAVSTKHFLAVLKFPGRLIRMPKRLASTVWGCVFAHNNAKKCPVSCKSENKTASPAIPLLSTSKNAVSTAKKSGERATFVLSTVKYIKARNTPSGLYSFRQCLLQNEGGSLWNGLCSQLLRFFHPRLQRPYSPPLSPKDGSIL